MVKDRTPAIERRILKEVRELEKKALIPQGLGIRSKLSASNPPRLCGLPKIHKPPVPLRLIVSCIGSTTYPLAKHVAFLPSPLTGKTSTFVQNSQHFVELIKDLNLGPAEAMVSFDIKSLFTNVPVDETLSVIHQLLSEDDLLNVRTTLSDDQVTHLLELCLKNNYFVYQVQYYKQKDGAAMGSPVSPVVANIYMQCSKTWHFIQPQ